MSALDVAVADLAWLAIPVSFLVVHFVTLAHSTRVTVKVRR